MCHQRCSRPGHEILLAIRSPCVKGGGEEGGVERRDGGWKKKKMGTRRAAAPIAKHIPSRTCKSGQSNILNGEEQCIGLAIVGINVPSSIKSVLYFSRKQNKIAAFPAIHPFRQRCRLPRTGERVAYTWFEMRLERLRQ